MGPRVNREYQEVMKLKTLTADQEGGRRPKSRVRIRKLPAALSARHRWFGARCRHYRSVEAGPLYCFCSNVPGSMADFEIELHRRRGIASSRSATACANSTYNPRQRNYYLLGPDKFV
jgi:hypothetical protein